MHKVGKGTEGKKKPWAVVEAVDPFELTSMNVFELETQGLRMDLGEQTCKERAEGELSVKESVLSGVRGEPGVTAATVRVSQKAEEEL